MLFFSLAFFLFSKHLFALFTRLKQQIISYRKEYENSFKCYANVLLKGKKTNILLLILFDFNWDRLNYQIQIENGFRVVLIFKCLVWRPLYSIDFLPLFITFRNCE